MPFQQPAWLIELGRPFRLDEHAFVGNNEDAGMPYLKKKAIVERLNRYCPGRWSMGRPELVASINDTISMTAPLTINGQTHWGLGVGKIQRFRKNNTSGEMVEIGAYDLATETSKACKSAASDCLTRAVYYFAIGWYLRDIPKQYKSMIQSKTGLAKYLDYCNKLYDEAYGNADAASDELKRQAEQAGQNGQSGQGEKKIDTETGEIKREAPAVSGPPFAVGNQSQQKAEPVDPKLLEPVTSKKLLEALPGLFDKGDKDILAFVTKWKSQLSGKNMGDAIAITRGLRWNRVPESQTWLLNFARSLSVTPTSVFSAMTEACGHPVTSWHEWDGGPLSRAAGAVVAWAADFHEKEISNVMKGETLADDVLQSAKDICLDYQLKERQP